MAKKIVGFIKLQVPAGKANPSPPIGPALGQRGLNIMEFCKAFNAATQEMEKGAPILTYASIANIGGGYVFFILIPRTWAAIAFRAETLDPSIIQIMNDWVWFDWLFTWPPDKWGGVDNYPLTQQISSSASN